MAVRFHVSLEAAQHGKKQLPELAAYARRIGCQGLQPSNFHLQDKNGNFLSPDEIKSHFGEDLHLDGISAHCPFWVHGTAWTESKTIRPFIPKNVADKSPAEIEQWAEAYILNLLDLAAELGVKVVPMFWGVSFGWELATGYPWGFFKGETYDLLEEGKERFRQQTRNIRMKATALGISLAHEIHPGTAACCADDFLMLRDICSVNECMGVNADPSHCWEGEDWETRFTKVGDYVTGCHVKDYLTIPGLPLRSMQGDWKKRGMQFTRFGQGRMRLHRYTQLMDDIGYTERYCKAHGTETAPLVGEGESAYYELDEVSAHGAQYTKHELCTSFATESFEDGMGEDE